MGIFSRLNRVIKSNLNTLIDQAEDPDKLIGQTVADMKSALGRARKELVGAMGSAMRLDKKEKELEAEALEWERKAILALEKDDEDLAREALRRKARALKEAQQVRARAAEQATARRKARRPEGAPEDPRRTSPASSEATHDARRRRG
jgi:phage shock protein A